METVSTRESVELKKEFQQMVCTLFDIAHGQDVDSHSRGASCAPTNTQAAQLQVLALKPDKLTFSMTTADLRIWKDAYKSYHNTSNFNRFHITEQQAFLYHCIDS